MRCSRPRAAFLFRLSFLFLDRIYRAFLSLFERERNQREAKNVLLFYHTSRHPTRFVQKTKRRNRGGFYFLRDQDAHFILQKICASSLAFILDFSFEEDLKSLITRGRSRDAEPRAGCGTASQQKTTGSTRGFRFAFFQIISVHDRNRRPS